MFGSKHPNYTKLRTNLRLCINRLKLLEKKKAELALKARKEIADYIAVAKEDRARIRVEHIIREDYLVEAMEIIEMFCDLLLARFGLIERMKEMDPGLEEAIATLLWVTPRLSSDVGELREVSNQLTLKYGKEFAESCRRNQLENVNEKVIHKLSSSAPPRMLIENYLVEIAKVFNVPFEPDPVVMADDATQNVDNLIMLDDDVNKPPDDMPGFGGGSGGGGNFMVPAGAVGPPAGAVALPAGAVASSAGPTYTPPSVALYPPGSAPAAVPPVIPPGQAPVFTLPTPGGASPGSLNSSGASPGGASSKGSPGAPPLPKRPPNASQDNSPVASDKLSPYNQNHSDVTPPTLPKYDEVMNSPTQYPPAGPSFPNVNPNHSPADTSPTLAPRTTPDGRLTPTPAPRNKSSPGASSPGRSPSPGIPQLPDVPGLPSVPTGMIGSTRTSGDDVDFDDLTRRFEELKRQK